MKEVFTGVMSIVVPILFVIAFIIVGFHISDNARFERNMKCIEIGKNYVVESNSWVCK